MDSVRGRSLLGDSIEWEVGVGVDCVLNDVLRVYGREDITESVVILMDPKLLDVASRFVAEGFIVFCTFEAGLLVPFIGGKDCESGR